MIGEEKTSVSLLVLISGRKEKDSLLTALSEQGAKVINTLYGRGSVKANYLMSMLGCVPEENKAVTTCLVSAQRLDEILDMLSDKFNFKSPNTGIAFTVPVNGLSF